MQQLLENKRDAYSLNFNVEIPFHKVSDLKKNIFPAALARKFKVNILLRKIFCEDLNKATSMAETASFRFARKIFLKEKLRFREF